MAFWPERLAVALEASRGELRRQQQQLSRDANAFDRALREIEPLSRAQLEALLDHPNPGALPSVEYERSTDWFLPFGRRWTSHEGARHWAEACLAGVTTVAVDGSEIRPTKDHTLPIGFVQVAWFRNPHAPAQRHEKDARVVVALPGTSQADVGLRRFLLECEQLCLTIQDLAESSAGDRPPVLFFDGTFVLSFTNEMPRPLGDRYVEGMIRLLETSEQLRIPVVGFTDTSEARDLVSLTARLTHVPLPDTIRDAPMLSPRMQWGDRTKAFVCARDDHVLERYRASTDERSLSREVCFTYLKTTSDRPPARLDVPRWVVEAGLLDHVADVVRAEVIATAAGYPYAIETADAAAVLAVADRERVLRAVQRFCDQEDLRREIVPTAARKRRRRD
ncbi:MAG: DNA double-strand break repair nuclease NurA [Chloroflexi bacterium]|nr:DNA double-strand break repair nuclease NurA [Chloroflexota bacterium]